MDFGIREEAARVLRETAAGRAAEIAREIEGARFVRRFIPEDRLIVLGGGHIAVPLCKMAAMLDFAVTVVDDRPSFANAARFPEAYSGGTIDRRALAARVFSDAEALGDLNTISHRFVRREVTRRLRDWAMAGGRLAAVDAIELIEGGLGERCDLVLGVLAPREERIRRIVLRDGITPERAAARVDAQKGDAYFKEKCDHILYNTGDEDQFSNTCREYFTEVLKNHG